jgi:nicotinate-nucleotide adenylyltransferase
MLGALLLTDGPMATADPSTPIPPLTPPLPLPRAIEHARDWPTGPGPCTLIVYGGMFDPPTVAHAVLPLIALAHVGSATLRPVGILYVPAARSPLKDAQPGASAEHRLEMLRLALSDAPAEFWSIWTDELDRARSDPQTPSYTVDTLRRARSALDRLGRSDVTLRLLIGADQALALPRWRSPDEVIALAEPLVLARADPHPPHEHPHDHAQGGPSTPPTADDLPQRLARAGVPGAPDQWRSRIVDAPALAHSSTAARRAAAAGRSSGFLHPSVEAYIREHRLYLDAPAAHATAPPGANT